MGDSHAPTPRSDFAVTSHPSIPVSPRGMFLALAVAHALVPLHDEPPCGTLDARRARLAGESVVRPARADGDGYDTEHFHIEGDGYEPTDEEYALLGAILEEVWAVEIDTLGFSPPYGEGPFNVYLEDMPVGLYGYTGVERDGQTAYVAINPDMRWTGRTTEEAWKVTAAHEFFHAIQFVYDYWEASWWMEASATWMEDAVYDEVNDYTYYLGEGSWPDYPEISMVAENGWHEYGQTIWAHYLADLHGGAPTIKTLWEACASATILDASADFFGSSADFEATVLDFQTRNVLAYAGYDEGADWFPVYTREVLAEGAALPAAVEPTEYYADYLGVNYWRLPLVDTADQDLVVDFEGLPMDDGNTVRWQLALVGTDGAAWSTVTDSSKDPMTLRLPTAGWTEAWVTVGILSQVTGVDHDQYGSNPRYTENPPSYRFELSLQAPLPDDTGSGDTGADDTGVADSGEAGDTATDHNARDDKASPGGEEAAACGCDGASASGAGGSLAGGSLLLAALVARRRPTGRR